MISSCGTVVEIIFWTDAPRPRMSDPPKMVCPLQLDIGGPPPSLPVAAHPSTSWSLKSSEYSKPATQAPFQTQPSIAQVSSSLQPLHRSELQPANGAIQGGSVSCNRCSTKKPRAMMRAAIHFLFRLSSSLNTLCRVEKDSNSRLKRMGWPALTGCVGDGVEEVHRVHRLTRGALRMPLSMCN